MIWPMTSICRSTSRRAKPISQNAKPGACCSLPLPVLLGLVCTACGSGAVSAATARAQRAQGIDLTYCLASLAADTTPEPARCPGFLVGALRDAAGICAGTGGKLVPAAEADIWTLDVDADGRDEYLYEQQDNVGCEGAWSIFSCGSLGCPKALYQERAGGWRVIGGIYADDMAAIERLDPPGGQDYRDLRVGCLDAGSCEVYAHYAWRDGQYDPSHLEVRGFRVEVADSIHGLYGLSGDTVLRATPVAGGAEIGRYGSDTIVAVIGTAVDGDWYYVSPCNACDSGFVARPGIRPLPGL